MINGPILAPAQVSPRDLAIGMTLLEGDRYKALRPSDYIMHLTKDHSENIKGFLETSEKLQAWITDRVLHYEIVDLRAGVLKFFINTALVRYSLSSVNHIGCLTISFPRNVAS